MFGLNKYIIIAFSIFILMFGGYFWYSQNEIATLNKTIVAKDIALDEQNKLITNLKIDVESIKQVNKELSIVEREATENASRLSDKLRNLGTIAKEKPIIVQDLINQSAVNRIRCFELATGAEPKKDEINKTCPHLLKTQQ